MEIKLSYERYEEIKQAVVNLFVEFNICHIPINGIELATKMNIKVIPYSDIQENKRWLLVKKSEDGFSVEKELGEWYIYYNESQTFGRINNTLLHEIGHIVLDHSEDSELAEKEVRFFAKYALVPPVLLHKLCITNFSDIETAFGVSAEAAHHAYSYYKKWLSYGPKNYTEYEKVLLNQFHKTS